ncbi:unnamed protein product, partial [Amoebophrya sp. A25]|eukprot:GSA25T00015752001.1
MVDSQFGPVSEASLGLEPCSNFHINDYISAGLPTTHNEILQFLHKQDGPRDDWRLLEDSRTVDGLSLSIEECIRWGISPDFIR